MVQFHNKINFVFSGGSGLIGSVVGGSVGHMLSDKAARKAAKKAAKHGHHQPMGGQYPPGQYPPGQTGNDSVKHKYFQNLY